MVHIALIEDDKNMQAIIKNCMEREIRESEKVEIDVFGEAENFQKSLMEGKEYHIVFSDVELGSMNGIALAKVLREKWPEIYVIFVTAYSEYAVESYELDAYQYILKEHMEERLPVILRKVLNKIKY
ncbi:LytR/AlgR family response regulator transcription factor [Lachnoclostridium phocaeense]|uniref:LytR/AlgR family response regulator transcription factor n=1 Tax=Lachnoclostridium phocaeense TaxID=1871021 RepID=UPI00248EB1F5|nr:response regulator [Lachnoclostridium phocaeense]